MKAYNCKKKNKRHNSNTHKSKRTLRGFFSFCKKVILKIRG